MSNMHTFVVISFVIACTLCTDCESTNVDSRLRRKHSRSDTRETPNLTETEHRRKHKRRYRMKNLLPEEIETTPIVETFGHLLRHINTMDYRRTQCKEIPPQFALCYDIGYTQMHLPNLMGHDSIDELVKQSNEWTPLLATRCHSEARKFLCSVFAPVCVQDFSKPIPPCRSLCEAVRDRCSPAMARFEYPWPHMLNCSQFPADDSLCIPSETREITEAQPAPPAEKICSPCRRKKISGNFKKKLCSFDFSRKSRTVFKWLNNVNQHKKKSVERAKTKKNIIWMRDGLNCTCDVLHNGVHVNYLIAGWLDKGKLKLYSITKWRKSDKRLSKILKRNDCKTKTTKNKRSEK